MSQDSFSLSHALLRIGGVLLAAGRGRRFDPEGRHHKLLARLPTGQSVVRASAMQMLPWVDTLTVVIGVHNMGVVRELADLPVQVVVCPEADQGPGMTLRTGLQASLQPHPQSSGRRNVGGVMIGLADMPFIAAASYERLRSHLLTGMHAGQSHAWRAYFEDQPGHPVVLTAPLAQQFLARPRDSKTDGKGLASLWRAQPSCLTCVDLDDPGCVRDVDVPEDLR